MGNEYEEELRIDPDKLDEEWLRQSNLYMKYAALHAEAVQVRDRAKDRVKVTEAELNLLVRSNPDDFGLGIKPTVDAVNSRVTSHPDMVTAKDELIEADYEVNIYNGAVFAFQHRKTALENLVRLHLGEYFTVDNLPHDLTGWRDERRERASDKQMDRMRRTRRTKT